VRRRRQGVGDVERLLKVGLGVHPVVGDVGEVVVVDHDQQVIVRLVAADGIVDPVAPRVAAEEDHLQDPALETAGRLALDDVLELPEQHLENKGKLGALAFGKMVEARLHLAFEPRLDAGLIR